MTDYTIRLVVEGQDAGATAVLRNVGSGLGSVSSIAAGFLGANIIQGIANQFVQLGQAGLDSYRYYERLDLSLQSLAAKEERSRDATLSMADAYAQSSGRAKELLGWVEQLAIKSPFDQQGVADAFRLQLAYGFTTQAAQKLTEVMIDWAAGSGRTTESMNRVSLALGQMAAQGRVLGGEVRQLTEAGISVDQILAEAFNKPTAEIVRMRQQGLIPANEAIQAIVDSLERDFGGAAERQSGTIEGLTNSLSDLKSISLREFFEGTFQAVQPKLQEFVDKLQDPAVRNSIRSWGEALGDFTSKSIVFFEQVSTKATELSNWWNSLDGSTQRLIGTLGAMVAIGPTAVSMIGSIVTTASALVGILPAVVSGFSAWQAGMSITTALGAAGIAPIAITVGAVAVAVGAVVAVWAVWNAEITKTNQEGVQAVNNQWVDFFNKQRAAGSDAKKMLEEYKAAQAGVNNEIAKAGPILGLFIDKQGVLTAGITELNNAMLSSASSYEEYVANMVNAGLATGVLHDETGLLTGDYLNNAAAMQLLADQLGVVSNAQWISAQVAATAAEKYGEVSDTGMLLSLQTGAQNVDGLSNSLGLSSEQAASAASEQERLADAARKAAFAHYDLAQSLYNAGIATSNKALLDQYRSTLESMELPPEVITQNMNAMGLEMGVIDQRSINLSNGISQLTNALMTGQIPIENSKEAWALYYKTVQTGNPDFEAVIAKFGTAPAAIDPASGAVNNAATSVGKLGEQSANTKANITTFADTAQTKLNDLAVKTVEPQTKKMVGDFGNLKKAVDSVGGAIGGLQRAAIDLYEWGQDHIITITCKIVTIGGLPSINSVNQTTGGTNNSNAMGGEVTAGVPTWIGERGRELFIPPVDGRILSSRDSEKLLSGSQGNTKQYNFYINGADNPMNVAQEIQRLEFFYA